MNDPRAWLFSKIAELLNLSPSALDPHERFHRLGLDSLGITKLAVALSRALERDVPPTVFWEYPSIEALAQHLANQPVTSSLEANTTRSRDRVSPDEPIAIIGMACRLPGADDPEAFWQMLVNGVDAVREAPRERWSMELARANLSVEDERRVRHAGWLERVDEFDSFFFGISPREAQAMDPQQRLTLELCWEALEDAGIRAESLVGSRTGVFAAAIWSDYASLQIQAGAGGIDQHHVTGAHRSIIANRISYFLGLQGPSLTLDAACSSGLVAVHLACSSLRSGECTLAFVPAVNLNILPESAVAVARLGALSPSARCHTFDARADGYVRGEGAGVVVLKRLSDAVRDGDKIHAVIMGSAVNNDGASNGLTSPNPHAQEALLREAYSAAGIAPHEVQYVEAHGTGTPLGDPLEAKALATVLGIGRPADFPLFIGSAKTNVGHLEGAAGTVGLIKVILSLKHRKIPANLHFERANAHIPLDEYRLAVPTSLREYPLPDRRLAAGVSSFGLGGTNAHVVLQEWPSDSMTTNLATYLAAADRSPIKDNSSGVVFVFPGQGAQWPGMAHYLLATEPVFRSVLQHCDNLVRGLLGFSLIDELLAPPERNRLHRIDISLPAIIAIDIAMATLWQSLGIRCSAVVGHSTGEIAAAYVAGALDLEDTMRVICAYGKIIARFSGRGAMLLVELPWERAADAITGFDGRIFPAIWDSRMTTVFAGEPAAIEALRLHLQHSGITARRVSIDVAPHCPLVDSVRDELAYELRTIRPRDSKIPLISEVTGMEVPGTSLDAVHWVRNFGNAAKFSPAIDTLIARGHRTFLDVGPHPLTRTSIETNLRQANVQGIVLGSMTRAERARQTIIDSLAKLEALGHRSRVATPGPFLIPLSAKTPQALKAHAKAHADHLESECPSLADWSYTLGVRRSHFEHRLAWIGNSRDELVAALRAFSTGKEHAPLVSGSVPKSSTSIIFVFPGQGSQWLGMGRGLLEKEPIFRETIESCNVAVEKESGFSILHVLRADEATPLWEDIDVVQPVLFAISVALAALWRSWGIVPAAVVGHSMGEVAAAHVAGALSLEDAAAIICRRSRLLRRMRGKGAMALVELSLVDAQLAIAPYEDQLSIAVNNGPRSTVIAGDPSALEQVLTSLEQRGIFCRRVKVDVASHSPQMDVLLDELRAHLGDLHPKQCSVPMLSTVTGNVVHGPELVASYWLDNLRRPVLFSPVIQALIAEGRTHFLEMSPHPILTPSVEENLREKQAEGEAFASLRRGQDEQASLYYSLARLHVAGHSIDFSRLHPNGGRVVRLPHYPWQRARHWIETSDARSSSILVSDAQSYSGHPLLGQAVSLASHPAEHLWERRLSVKNPAYLGDHRVEGVAVFPGTGFVEMALAAASGMLNGKTLIFERVAFESAFSLPENEALFVQLAWNDIGANEASFIISSRAESSKRWTKHASGTVSSDNLPSPHAQISEPLRQLQQQMTEFISARDHYQRMRERNLDYGPAFQGLSEIWVGNRRVLGRLQVPTGIILEDYHVHPAWLDAAFQVSVHLLPAEASKKTCVPVKIERLCVYGRATAHAWVLANAANASEQTAGEYVVNLDIVDEQGVVLMAIEGLALQCLDTQAPQSHDTLAECLYEVVFRPLESLPEAALSSPGDWLVFVDQSGPGVELAHALMKHRQRCIFVRAGTSFAQLDSNLFTIDIARPDDYATLLQRAFGRDGTCHGCIHLLSLDAAPVENTTLESLDSDLVRGACSVTHLAHALAQHGFRDIPRLSVVTRGMQGVHSDEPISISQSPLLGLTKTLALELPELDIRCIDLSALPCVNEVDALLREVCAPEREEQIALRSSGRYAARMVRTTAPMCISSKSLRAVAPGEPFRLEIRVPGQIDNLALYSRPRPVPGPEEVIIEVESAGLNFRDVLVAIGALQRKISNQQGPNISLGGECAGRIVMIGKLVPQSYLGAEVIALGVNTIGSHVVRPWQHVVAKPRALDWHQAATMPIALLTAHYALDIAARLQPGERVLVHAGTGGVGLAAIQWAQHVGAEVFATAGTNEKRAHLRAIGVPHVFDSRSLDFAREIRQITRGEGIDVVLNSLAGEFADVSLNLLREYGRFIEIGKRDIYDNRPLGLQPFERNLSYAHVNLLKMLTDRPHAVKSQLDKLLHLIEQGHLKPLPVQTFPISRASEAFDYMARAKHIGKIALTMNDPEARVVAENVDTPNLIRPDRTYLITGGLGGLGFFLAQRLVESGAKHLMLMGRSKPTVGTQQAIDDMATRHAARISCIRGDVSKPHDVDRAFAVIDQEMMPLGGIIHAAAILDDHTAAELSSNHFRSVFAPKALGAWNLHQKTRHRSLDFFILYSSVASLMGSPGQGNYCAANAFLDALAQLRKRRGLPALSIQWGAFADLGLAAARGDRGARLASRGTGSLLPGEGFEALKQLVGDARSNVGVVRFEPRRWLEFYPSAARLRFFKELFGRDDSATRVASSNILHQLQTVPTDARTALLEKHVTQEVAAVLRCDSSRVDRLAPFQTLGLDSLLSLELRNRLEASMGIRLSATLLFTHATNAALSAHLLSRLDMLPPAQRQSDAQPIPHAKSVAPLAIHTDKPLDDPRRPLAAAGLHEDTDVIAVIAVACRFPAGSVDPEAFWRALQSETNGVVRISDRRWPANTLPEGRSSTRWAGLLDEIDRFDAAFFGISPREAAQMDPQQRLLLEVTHEALERGGQIAEKLLNTRTGVFVGMCNADYMQLLRKTECADAYTVTGNMFNTASGRISYTFGFQGPCLTVDTACSSSLAAVHMGVQSLRNGECNLAITGGVNLLLDPQTMQMVAEIQALSPDGRCKTFDATANGFVRGEGCGIVLLKRFVDAKRDGDPILALIRGSIMNQVGRSSGLTAPNVLAQQAMLRTVLQNAKLSPEDIGYIETHGTGTPLGDPIEFESLREVLGLPRADGSSCILGAVKTNIGHLEAAAGVAGMIKAILCFAHESIPPNLHFTTLNPRMSLEGTPFVIPTRTVSWNRQLDKPRRAGISSFGISGTNVHVILEEAPASTLGAPTNIQRRDYILPLSAKTPMALISVVQAFIRFLSNTDESLSDIIYTASCRRSHFGERIAILASSKKEMVTLLQTITSTTELAERIHGTANDELFAQARDYVSGRDIDWQGISGPGRCLPTLPTYSWQRQRHWFNQMAPNDPSSAALSIVDESLEEIVLAEVARALRMDSRTIDKTTQFSAMGMDSLMSLELRNRLEAKLEHRFSAAALAAHPTVEKLTEYLRRLPTEAIPPSLVTGESRYPQPGLNNALNGPVLLTGATGFLGTHLLRNILRAGASKVYCVVRADDDALALRRLRAAMRHYCSDSDVPWERVVPILGDIAKSRLGIDETRLLGLAQEVEWIYHNGAMLDFVLPYERLADANVKGTAELIRMALRSPKIRFQHVSTVGVLSQEHPHCDNRLIEVATPNEGQELIPCGYTQTKRTAENLVLSAMQEGLRASVYRPTVISGDTAAGHWNLDDAMCRILKGCIQAGCVPDIDWRANLAPVDFVAQAIVHLSMRPEQHSAIFHVANAESTHFSQLVDYMRRRGYHLETTSHEEWLTRIGAQGRVNALEPLIPWIRQAQPFLNVEYDCTVLVKALQGSPLRCPPINDQLLDLYFDSFVRAGFLPAASGTSP